MSGLLPTDRNGRPIEIFTPKTFISISDGDTITLDDGVVVMFNQAVTLSIIGVPATQFALSAHVPMGIPEAGFTVLTNSVAAVM